MKIRPGNAQHQGSRDSQQDSFAFSDLDDRDFVAHGGVLGVVADGMGGLEHGGAAATLAVRSFLQRYQAKQSHEAVSAALWAALQAANEAVLDLARSAGQVGNVGATLVAAVIKDDSLYWISVGDSRAYLLRRWQLEQLTLDHVYATELDLNAAAGRIGRETAQQDPERDALTSHLGKDPLTLVDRSVQGLPLAAGDRVLLCSDGLYRALPPAEIARAFATSPQRACEELVDRVLRKQLNGQDNVTAVALAFDVDTVTTTTAREADLLPLPGPSSTEPASTDLRSRADVPSEPARRLWIRASWAAGTVLLLLALAGFWWEAHRASAQPDTSRPTIEDQNPDPSRRQGSPTPDVPAGNATAGRSPKTNAK
jgi:protein phosphatase